MPQILEGDYLQDIGPYLVKLGYECGVLSGGSYSYKYSLYSSLSELRDLDLFLVLKDKDSVTDLLTIHQQCIDEMLHLTDVEKHLSREDIKPFISGHADAVRYSGINDLGQKISVKIIDYPTLQNIYHNETPGRINVLSKKDKRLYLHKTLQGENALFGVVNQRINSGMCILGDPDLISTGSKYCLGVISDLFLSGKIIYQSPSVNMTGLREELIKKVAQKVKESAYPQRWSDILVRCDRMMPDFKNNFDKLFPKISLGKTNKTKDVKKTYSVHIVSPIIEGKYSQLRLKKKITSSISEKRYLKSAGPFSSNSNYGLAIFKSGEKTFFKEMLNEFRFRGEVYGLITASAYYRKLKEPVYSDPVRNLIAYDWFPGDILARQRLRKMESETFEKIIDLELKRAEDHLNAYIRSAMDFNKSEEQRKSAYRSRIHDVFYGRLTGDRLKNHYDTTSFPISGKLLSFDQLKELPFLINGVKYPSISQLITVATDKLNPVTMDKKEMICGLGDSHSGNIMCSQNLEDYEYIDYELAGFHSPYLDISKQIYYDTSYEIFYSDKIVPKDFDLTVSLENDTIVINHNFKPDLLSCYLYKTKIEGIIAPYRSFCADNNLILDEDWKETLGLALFCNGLIDRNLSLFNQKYFYLGISNAVESTNIDIYSRKYYSQM